MKKIATVLALSLLLIILSSAAMAQEIPENAIGVIAIPCLDITMPLYVSDPDNLTHRQEIIDCEESALYCNWGNAYQILDHIGSLGTDSTGEWYIQKIFSGAYAYLYTKDGRYYYECYMTGKTEYDGNEYINGRLVTPCSSHDIMLSCCAEDSDHHFIAVFRRLKEF